MALRVTAAAGEHDLLFLPWDVPLSRLVGPGVPGGRA